MYNLAVILYLTPSKSVEFESLNPNLRGKKKRSYNSLINNPQIYVLFAVKGGLLMIIKIS